MKEQVNETVVCLCCGARAGGVVRARVVTVSWDDGRGRAGGLAREARAVTKRRSGLAYAAGYAGLAYLFTLPFAGTYGATRYFPLASLWALAALVLSFAAARSLDGSRDREGALPALLGFFVGLAGTFLPAMNLLVPGGLLRLLM